MGFAQRRPSAVQPTLASLHPSTPPPQVSTTVLELQRLLPRARFVYCSATGVSGAGWSGVVGLGRACEQAGGCLLPAFLLQVTPCTPAPLHSCTPAAEVGNLAYMERLGLWGPGAAFPSFQVSRAALRCAALERTPTTPWRRHPAFTNLAPYAPTRPPTPRRPSWTR